FRLWRMTQPSAHFQGLITQVNEDPGAKNPVLPLVQARPADASSGGETAPVSPPAVVVRSLSSRLLCCFLCSKQTRLEPEEAEREEVVQRDGDAVPPSRGHSPISYPQSTSNYKAPVPAVKTPPLKEKLSPQVNEEETGVVKVKSGNRTKEVSPEQKPLAAVVRPTHRALLPPQVEEMAGRKTLVLDLDETLVHSSFTEVPCEMVLTLVLGNEEHKVYVKKRPGVDEFLTVVSKWYEVVIFTASTAIYANALLDELDINGDLIVHRLFRQACTRFAEGYVKDLSKLGRNVDEVIIIDNSPMCYALQPENAIPIKTWKDDPSDTELYDLLPILVSLARVEHVPQVLQEVLGGDDSDHE
ncbi:unnamed protein product, partial [Polarella glacialis]